MFAVQNSPSTDTNVTLKRRRVGLRASRRGFTIVELLVVIGIIAVLLSILLPTLSVVRRNGQRIACRAKLHDIGNLCQMYLNDNKGIVWQVNAVPWISPPLNNLPSITEVFAPYTAPHGWQVSYPNNSIDGTGWKQLRAGRAGWLCPSDFLAKTATITMLQSDGSETPQSVGGAGSGGVNIQRYYDLGGSSYRVNTFVNDFAAILTQQGIITPAPKFRQVLDAFSRRFDRGNKVANPDELAAHLWLFTDWDTFHTGYNNPALAANDINAQNYLFANWSVGPLQY